ncbi:MAG TPA: ABC transporter ATP-binding protein, partial [Gammaproteobacteria bacterium]|nr:ABC transporter ATP-binding protein [Gammaproteobacteria bacterium]
VEDVDLTVPPGEFLGLVGPNGGGKSTLLKVILGLVEPASGRVRLFGDTPGRARRRVGYVPQYAAFRRDFPISVNEVVLTGRLGRTRARVGYDRTDRAVVSDCLDAVEAGDLAGERVGALSGGQFQRVLIARALAGEPELLILDEPTANIDPRVEKDLFELLREFNRRMTIIVVTHDIGFVSEYVNRVACLNSTLICHTAESLSPEVLERLYGRPMRAVDHRTHG